MIGLTRRAAMLAPVAMATGRAAAQPAESALAAPVADLYAALDTVMRSGRRRPFAERFDVLAPVVDRVFDLLTVLRVSIGPRWETMEPATQARLGKGYRPFHVGTSVAAL